MSAQDKFTYKYTGDFRFDDHSFIEDLKKLILYYETTGQSVMVSPADCAASDDIIEDRYLSDWIRLDTKTLFIFFRYFEAGHCIDHEHINVLDYVFHFFDLPFKLEKCKDIFYKQFDGFSMLCFTPDRPASWKYMYFNEKRNVAVPLEIWTGQIHGESSIRYKFWVQAFRSVEKDKNFEHCYQCWEVVYANESCEFHVEKTHQNKFEISLSPTENCLPLDVTVTTGAGQGVCRSCQWKTKRHPILAPIPPEQTIGE